MKTLLSASVAAVLGFSTVGFAEEIRINFNDVDGFATSLWYGTDGSGQEELFGGSNTGADPQFRTYLGRRDSAQSFAAALYRPILPANFFGGTVNSATFTISEATFNAGVLTGVELNRIDLPGATHWDPGDGAFGNRFDTPDNGAQRFWADFDVANDNGLDWDGNVVGGPWNGGSSTDFETAAVAELIDAETVDGGTSTTWDVLTLAQGWASGIWAVDGFTINTFNNANPAELGNYQLRTDGTSRGLVIDYTPIPEPASLSLLALGGLAVLRRRSR